MYRCEWVSSAICYILIIIIYLFANIFAHVLGSASCNTFTQTWFVRFRLILPFSSTNKIVFSMRFYFFSVLPTKIDKRNKETSDDETNERGEKALKISAKREIVLAI